MTDGGSACGQVCPFTLGQYEENEATLGWQRRLLGTEVMHHAERGRAWRWDLFCPACAGEMSPRPPGSWRIRTSGG
ncbi:MAG: hypothetical protein BroJett024_43100 [Alphaproteobacteria bacterium]|nr:MAG: hypothetical protein BroJett024_43100 [Alphaproteobacteria bacterium]